MEHDADACGQCQYVAHRDFIIVSSAQRAQAEATIGKLIRWCWGLADPDDSVVELGLFTLPNHTWHKMFYLAECPNCHEQYVDYVHGYEPRLDCQNCRWPTHLRQARFYIQNGLPLPPSRLEQLKHAFKAWRLSRA